MKRILPLVDALMRASNLSENQAKTLIYYCLMTWSDEPKKRPILVLDGESGTGKNDLMGMMYDWCRHETGEPGKRTEWVNADRMSEATLRDQLADKTTVFVEEADKTVDPAKSEGWYKIRYEETGRGKKYRRQTVNSRGYMISKEETHDHYGYTVLHVQNAFQSTEMDRRTLRVTIFKDNSRKYKVIKVPINEVPMEIAEETDWDAEIEQEYSGSAWDVWLPLMRTAKTVDDTEWLEYARKQIDLKTQEDALSKVYEPKGIVLSEIIPLYRAALDKNVMPKLPNRIAITEVRKAIAERGYNYTEKQIAKAARDLGFRVYYPQNKAHIKVEGEELLKSIGARAGYCEEEDSMAETTALAVEVG